MYGMRTDLEILMDEKVRLEQRKEQLRAENQEKCCHMCLCGTCSCAAGLLMAFTNVSVSCGSILAIGGLLSCITGMLESQELTDAKQDLHETKLRIYGRPEVSTSTGSSPDTYNSKQICSKPKLQ